jgi:hypothetical protein
VTKILGERWAKMTEDEKKVREREPHSSLKSQNEIPNCEYDKNK